MIKMYKSIVQQRAWPQKNELVDALGALVYLNLFWKPGHPCGRKAFIKTRFCPPAGDDGIGFVNNWSCFLLFAGYRELLMMALMPKAKRPLHQCTSRGRSLANLAPSATGVTAGKSEDVAWSGCCSGRWSRSSTRPIGGSAIFVQNACGTKSRTLNYRIET